MTRETELQKNMKKYKDKISEQVWKEVKPKVEKQINDAFKEFENMFDKKSYILGYNKGIQETKEQIRCEKCGRKDCLNILCHSDLAVLRQDIEKDERDKTNAKWKLAVEKLKEEVDKEAVNRNVLRYRLNLVIDNIFKELTNSQQKSIGDDASMLPKASIRQLSDELSNPEEAICKPKTLSADTQYKQKGCGKKMDMLGYIICGEFDDLKHDCKQWLCDDCKKGDKIFGELI